LAGLVVEIGESRSLSVVDNSSARFADLARAVPESEEVGWVFQIDRYAGGW
jgi:hypothetical protein